MSGREVADNERQLVALLKADYESTQRALAGFVTSGGQLRAIGIAAWGVVFAASLQAKSIAIAVMAGLLAVAFAVADGYYGALYRQTLARTRDIEVLLGEYHKSLGIHASDQRKVLRAVTQLEQHRFGVHRDMRPVNREPLWWLPRPVRVTWIYGMLILSAASAAVVFARAGQDTCTDGRAGTQPSVVYMQPAPSARSSAAPTISHGTPAPSQTQRTTTVSTSAIRTQPPSP